MLQPFDVNKFVNFVLSYHSIPMGDVIDFLSHFRRFSICLLLFCACVRRKYQPVYVSSPMSISIIFEQFLTFSHRISSKQLVCRSVFRLSSCLAKLICSNFEEFSKKIAKQITCKTAHRSIYGDSEIVFDNLIAVIWRVCVCVCVKCMACCHTHTCAYRTTFQTKLIRAHSIGRILTLFVSNEKKNEMKFAIKSFIKTQPIHVYTVSIWFAWIHARWSRHIKPTIFFVCKKMWPQYGFSNKSL